MVRDNNTYFPSSKWLENAHVNSIDKYNEIYEKSIKDPDQFWASVADRIDWYKRWDKVSDVDYNKAKISWYLNGKLNVSYNCIDRHVESGNGDKTAIIWEGNDPSEDKKYTYSELLIRVKKFANVLKSLGVKKGDRVCLY
ncbi:MAG: acetyl-coenzyme A synthetase N-terminal domain-containing protein, partial [Candidatus Marinimicrobia bacterium]|nr:acetyl-coenzyme A synthetase N-terminal domain-containing protein [Candidatus Neomarinimicrobiota bacterium]